MLSLPRNFNGRKKTLRSRAGCKYCRSRKLKCDEDRPRCRRCLEFGIDCQYGLVLTWPDEAAARGVMIGRVGAGKTKRRDLCRDGTCSPVVFRFQRNVFEGDVEFLSTNFVDIEMYLEVSNTSFAEDSEYETPSARSTVPSLKLQPTPYRNHRLSEVDGWLFQFYSEKMCSTCTLFDGQHNGYRHVIIPLSLHSELLMGSVLAVAANHVSFQEPSYHKTALKYRGRALQSLRSILQTTRVSQPLAEVLGTIMMLCYFDISDGCQSKWLVHLKGASSLIRLTNECFMSKADGFSLSFVGQYFTSHCVMAYTALADPLEENRLLRDSELWLAHSKRPLCEIDCSVGCSNELMSIILEIYQRIRQHWKSNCKDYTPDLLSWRASTERTLQFLTQILPPSNTANHADSMRTLKSAEAFRQACLLMLQYLNPRRAASAENILVHTMAVLEIIRSCPVSPAGGRSSSLWPFFIAACHSIQDQDRLFVLRRFRQIESHKRFGNVTAVRQVVELVWKQIDLSAGDFQDLFSSYYHPTTLSPFIWETVMTKLNSTLSLT